LRGRRGGSSTQRERQAGSGDSETDAHTDRGPVSGAERCGGAVAAGHRQHRTDDRYATLVTLRTDDARLTMPPLSMGISGPGRHRALLTSVVFRDRRPYRLISTRANGPPAFGFYAIDEDSSVAHAYGALVLTLTCDAISMLTRYIDNSVLPAFGFSRTVPR
jgi:hypothetical protein